MSNIDKQALRSTSDRDWFEDWFKREFHPDKTGPYIKDQLFFAVRAARAPLLDELEAAEKRIAELEELEELFLRAKALMHQSGGTPIENSLNPVDAWLYEAENATAGKGE
ncbi:hypothetical protein [Enterobacter hormaechei]|uniref:hypothetical protein n=1 Tax=Enterobacter hormaechei TaxID=158836 RepID=UPI003A97EC56